MLSDDLVPLITGGPGPSLTPPALRFRQGRVVSWNTATGSNTIDVGGAVLVDVPILNTGEAIALKAGHIVGLLAFNNTFWILGRITVPGDVDFASASVSFGNTNVTTTNWAPITSASGGTDVISSTPITIPDWADEAVVVATANVRVNNTRTVADSVMMHPFITTTFGGGVHPSETSTYLAAGVTGSLTNSSSVLLNDFDPTSENIVITVNVATLGANWPANVTNTAILSAIAIFRSTV
jgi:hypothetical protein